MLIFILGELEFSWFNLFKGRSLLILLILIIILFLLKRSTNKFNNLTIYQQRGFFMKQLYIINNMNSYKYRQNTRCRLFNFKGFFVHNNPEAEAQRSYAHALSLFCHQRVTPLGFGLRLIGNENPQNLEKTISSVLSNNKKRN